MSRRANNLKRMKDAKRRRRQAKESTALAAGDRAGSNQRGNDMHSNGERTTGSVVVIDKFTGEVREGGPELYEEMNATFARERERSLASRNPCYLVGRVLQNEGAFDAEEVKRMVDATFECACLDSPDAWYPNQYALALAHATKEDAAPSIAYFLSNFELGLRISGERAKRHRGHGDWLKESRQLTARLDEPDGLDQLSPPDLLGVVAYVAAHPRYAEAMSCYERKSGRKMNLDGTGGMPPGLEKIAQALLASKGVDVLEVGRGEVVDLDLRGALAKLRGLTADAASVVREKGRLGLVFSGWDSDRRELWEIAEVRAYFAALDEEFPYWMWFLMPSQLSLAVLLLCPCGKQTAVAGGTRTKIPPHALKAWYLRHSDAVIHLAVTFGLSPDEVANLFRAFAEILAAACGDRARHGTNGSAEKQG